MEKWLSSGSRPATRPSATACNGGNPTNKDDCTNSVTSSSVHAASTRDSSSGISSAKLPCEEVLKGGKKRKYCESYLDMGFTEFTDGRPQCVVCTKVLPNSSMFPAKLRRHFDTHPEYKNRTSDYFKTKSCELHEVQKKFVTHVKSNNEKALKASYLVHHALAVACKPHTLGESLYKTPAHGGSGVHG